MRRFKNLVIVGWICLIVMFLMEQTTGITVDTAFKIPDYSGEPAGYQSYPDPCSCFIVPVPVYTSTITVTDFRQTLFKWRSIKPEIPLTPCAPKRTYPEFVQDIWRCLAVAYVLYPYHEFL